MNEITALATLRPSGPDGDPAAVAAIARARAQLVDRATGRAGQSSRHAGPGRRRLVAVGAVVLLAAAGGLVVDSLTLDNRPVGASAEAASLLHQAADRAIGASDPAVGPDEYLHVTTVAVYSGGTLDARWLDTYTDELFVPGDPANDWVLRRSPRVPYRPVDAEIAGRGVPLMEGFTERARDGAFFGQPPVGGWQSPTPDFLASLPREPDRLLDRIYDDSAGSGPSPDGEALVYIADVLRSGIVPGELRAALFRAAALIPGVELTDRQANLNGQTGVAVGRYEAAQGSRQEIIFDPDTGMLIGEREVLVDRAYGPSLSVGTAVAWTAVTVAVVPAEVVDAIPAQPLADG